MPGEFEKEKQFCKKDIQTLKRNQNLERIFLSKKH